MDEKITLKIRKLLELSKSSNTNEATNALMKAQAMLAKYKLSLKDVESISLEQSNIGEVETNSSFTKKKNVWKLNLARVIAENFGCKLYFRYYGSSTARYIVFFGKEEDVNIANIVFEYALKFISAETNKLRFKYKREKKSVAGLETNYALGFIEGLKVNFENQKSQNQEWALVLTVTEEVENAYSNLVFSKRKFSIVEQKTADDSFLFNQGYKDGEKFSIADKIAEGEECTEPKQLLM